MELDETWLAPWVKEKNKRMKPFEGLEIKPLQSEIDFLTSCLDEFMGRLFLTLGKENEEKIKNFLRRTIHYMTFVLNEKDGKKTESYEQILLKEIRKITLNGLCDESRWRSTEFLKKIRSLVDRYM